MPERQHATWGELLREAIEKPGRTMTASTGLFLPTDSAVFKVEADFFQMQTAHGQQAIEVLSFISLACHHEPCLRAKLFFPHAHILDQYRLELKFPPADVICPCGISGQRRDRVLHSDSGTATGLPLPCRPATV